MGELRLSGLATGIDTTELVRQLMIVNSRRLATYQVKKLSYENKSSVYDELRSKVRALDSTVAYLSDVDDLEIFNATSSDRDILTVSASSSANPGSHTVEIDQLATSETWIQDTSTFSYETDYVGGGDFIYSYNHQERVITAVEDVTTLEDFVGLINNDPDNPGVTASLLYQGDKYHLMLSGQETGEDYQISINTSTTEVWESSTEGGSFTKDGENATLSTKITELGEFTANLGLQGDEFITISGENHFGTDISTPGLNLDVTANTTVGHLIDAINEHFDGVATAVLINGEIRLTDHINGTSGMEIISLGYDAGSGDTELVLPTMAVSTAGGTAGEISSLSPSSFIQTQGAQSSKVKMDGYPSSTDAEEQTLTLDAVADGGHFHLTYDGQTTGEILHTASTNDIKTALEALSNVSEGDIIVGGTGLDQAGTTTFTFLSTAGDVSMISIDASALTGPTSYSFTETTKGNDGWLNRNGNSISDALTGITLNLKDVTQPSEPIEITVARDTAAVRNKIRNMVTVYNALVTFLAEKTEYNDETKEMGILSTDIATSLVKTQMREPFIGVATGFTEEDTFFQAGDIGITFDGDGKMEFDTDDFNDAIAEDFMAVLELLGATKSGDTEEGSTIEFYSASDKYTTAGTYDVEVEIVANGGNKINSAKIKLSTESTYRDATWIGNLITGDSTFDDDGTGPLYPENSLQLTVDLSVADTFTGTIRVKQGMAGALEDFVDKILKAHGRIDIAEDIVDDNVERMEKIIEREEARLEDIEVRLIAKFARLEKTLTLLQQQFGVVSIFSIVE